MLAVEKELKGKNVQSDKLDEFIALTIAEMQAEDISHIEKIVSQKTR